MHMRLQRQCTPSSVAIWKRCQAVERAYATDMFCCCSASSPVYISQVLDMTLPRLAFLCCLADNALFQMMQL